MADLNTAVAVKLSPATLDAIRADVPSGLLVLFAPLQLDPAVPEPWVWLVDADGRVLKRQQWRDGELIRAGP